MKYGAKPGSFRQIMRKFGIWEFAITEIITDFGIARLAVGVSPQADQPILIRVLAGDNNKGSISVCWFGKMAWGEPTATLFETMQPGDQYGNYPALLMPEPMPYYSSIWKVPDHRDLTTLPLKPFGAEGEESEKFDPNLADDLRKLLDDLEGKER